MLQYLLTVTIVMFMVGNLLEVGLRLDVAEARAALRNVRFVVFSFIWCFILAPALAVLLTKIIPLAAPYALGLIFLGMAPCSPALPTMVKKAEGSLAYMSAFMLVAFVGTVLLMPFMVPLLAKGFTAGPWTIAKPLVFFIAIPLVAGAMIRHVAARFAEKAAPIVKKVTSAGTITLVAVVIWLYWREIFGAVGTYAIATQILYYALLGAASYLLGFGLSYEQKAPTLGICTRNVGPAVAPLFAVAGAPQGAITMCILATFLGAVLSGFVTAAVLKRFCVPAQMEFRPRWKWRKRSLVRRGRELSGGDMRRRMVNMVASVILGCNLPLLCDAQPARVAPDEAYQIGMEAYVYFYPLVTMDVTRRQLTNIEAGKMAGRSPMNTFAHLRAYPTAEFREVVRPNFDTLYSTAWLDLSKEPIIISVPDTAGRYYLLPMLDMWSDVFAVPGKRTSGTRAADYAVVAPGWTGRLPDGVEKIQAPTPYVWVIGRTQTNGPSDYEAVHKIQDGFRATPLSQWGKSPVPVAFKADPSVDMKTPPLIQVNSMPAKVYFPYAAELMKVNPPHLTDWSMLALLNRIGIEPGKSLVWESLDPAVQDALTRASGDALKAMYAKAPTIARVVDGWQMNTDTMGVYGNHYFKRAIVAMVGLGANPCDDAMYPLNIGDADGKPLQGEGKYVLHFNKEQLPPADAFWSLTLYDAQGFQVANPIDRYAIGDRDPLTFNQDGSLDLYIQHETPGTEKESNWLPSPATGTLSIVLRLYAPRAIAIYGRWTPPAVQRVQERAEALPQ